MYVHIFVRTLCCICTIVFSFNITLSTAPFSVNLTPLILNPLIRKDVRIKVCFYTHMYTGEVIIKKGTVVGPAEVGLLATVGVMSVLCYTQPVIGILSTGSELVNPWEVCLYGGSVYV
jgi:hypothetical protein